jgi:hypothetical protein
MTDRDRRAAVIASTVFNGIDFIEIADATQMVLKVHFLNAVAVKGTLTGAPTITGGDVIRSVTVLPIADTNWGWDEEHVVLTIHVAAPGDFSIYRLAIPSPALDVFFNHTAFSFKAECPSDLDCAPAPEPCPPATADTPPINYLARDFASFRQALLDFSSLRYSGWQERSEADFGVMFLEALSAVADDFSYMQDRVAAEATLATATQRRSVIRHARLVDYEPSPSTSASVMLQFDVSAGVTSIAHGLGVNAVASDGSRIAFETGDSLVDRLIDPLTNKLRTAPPTSPASVIWNAGLIKPYWFDDSQRCLPAGATHMHVLGRGYDFKPGQSLLIETLPESSADTPIRQIVRLLEAGSVAGVWATEESDPLFLRPADPPGAHAPFMTVPTTPPAANEPTAVTRIAWQAADALTVDRDLTRTTVIGNIVPATQGRTISSEAFVVTAAPPGDPTPTTFIRTGPRQTLPTGGPGTQATTQLYALRNAPLTWLPQVTLDPSGRPLPEIVVTQQTDAGETVICSWFRWLLDADAFDNAFTIDAARFGPIARNSDTSIQTDYVSDSGDTLRFGDGSFGLVPDDGARFAATYRVGNGAAGNLASGAVREIGASGIAAGLLTVTNPLAARGGSDPESLTRVAQRAPQAFRAKTFRAVIPKDYQAAAETLPWVQRAGCVFRWTGSWLTVFTTPDPLGSETLTIDERTQLIDLLNRYRMAGYESYVPDPRYASVELEIEVCAKPTAFTGDVKSMIIDVLSPTRVLASAPGFFAPDNFTFGQPLERSALEATIQNVVGVAGVRCIHYRRRDRMRVFAEMPDLVAVAPNEIIRCDNDPNHAEHGTFSITVEGGR